MRPRVSAHSILGAWESHVNNPGVQETYAEFNSFMQNMADSLRDIHCDAGEQWFEDTQSPEDSVLMYALRLERIAENMRTPLS
ncbi:uncharacterized protein N7525_006575 [Penicillium rubens]|uniref:uncharacterized protein n=1 Tax=Penicillium rubens TaxID=1108849 RepID=UPI002A5ADA63|nr:uncharacterized protein N7525_006575 [Penicillium rubens]KAJ5828322.1 hypothetical protein N7525_006575 [Penicillium rubens]KAJ5841950.1 hypothetical protein N7534_011780 [Penicillium rubens]